MVNHENELRVYTLEESAAILRCEPGWLAEQAQQGKIPYFELNGSRLFTAGHLAAVVAARERLPVSEPGATGPLFPPLAWNTAEAAELLRCTASWLKGQARSQRIPHTKLSGSYRFTDDHLTEIIRIFEVRPPRHVPAPAAPPAVTPRHPVLPAPVPGREPVTIVPREMRRLRGRRACDDDPGAT